MLKRAMEYEFQLDFLKIPHNPRDTLHNNRVKNFDSRVYSINDILEWYRNEQLVLSPRFQRRSVWNDNARSFLMDTIIRGLPMPKIFMRQQLNTLTQKSVREVVDGQQRLRTILSYLNDGFQIKIGHNEKYGGRFFSQLSTAEDNDVQTNILNYEIAVDLLVNMPDGKILDVFSRLNSYAVVLNEQERLNADHFGPFKVLADRLGHKHNDIWISNKILTEMQTLRMGDVALVAELLIVMTEGIRSKDQMRKYFDQYEDVFPYHVDDLEVQFDTILGTILDLMGTDLRSSEYRRVTLFYSLFTVLYHARYGLKNFDYPRAQINPSRIARIRTSLDRVDELFQIEDTARLSEAEKQFKEDARRATTGLKSRVRRSEFINELLLVL